ncbi:30S ribosomal protein S4 [Candidatus Parvarchaeota archaeon]|uniref:Small ribosomal subunit protein uS4 n=1 Tax=Candidatus Acidifodinimicrobium mancum TaxID=2898728 RepID=A0A8T3V2L0_9ARCH|nr:30S ribosomal protein S4 [Candidatus Acidifodinimicrobium mancum]
MGTSKRQTNKFKSPTKIWDKSRIDRDRILRKRYGFKNKKELWKEESFLRNIRKRARDIIASKATNTEAEGEKTFIETLNKLGLVGKDATEDNVLELGIENILERRLQTIVFKKKLARSINEARQMITHSHIALGDKVVSAPSMLVNREDEEKVNYAPNSPFKSEAHPIRANKEENKG